MANEIAQLMDPNRLAVAGAIALEPRSSSDIEALTGLDQAAVLSALGELRSVGLVAVVDGGYRIDQQRLRETAEALAERDLPMDPSIGFGMTTDEKDVLARYFSGRVLHTFPSSRAVRLVILERLSLEFEPGRRVTESELNATLGEFNRDTAALRRALVDEGFLDREHIDGDTWYFRSGGRVV